MPFQPRDWFSLVWEIFFSLFFYFYFFSNILLNFLHFVFLQLSHISDLGFISQADCIFFDFILSYFLPSWKFLVLSVSPVTELFLNVDLFISF